jgi:YCII-related domain
MEVAVKKFVFLSYGYKTPTQEIMGAWSKWFEQIKGNIVDMAGFGAGREISKDGTKDLPLDLESITGFVIVNAESLEAAEKMAQSNPYITSIRVYEVRSK